MGCADTVAWGMVKYLSGRGLCELSPINSSGDDWGLYSPSPTISGNNVTPPQIIGHLKLHLTLSN